MFQKLFETIDPSAQTHFVQRNERLPKVSVRAQVAFDVVVAPVQTVPIAQRLEVFLCARQTLTKLRPPKQHNHSLEEIFCFCGLKEKETYHRGIDVQVAGENQQEMLLAIDIKALVLCAETFNDNLRDEIYSHTSSVGFIACHIHLGKPKWTHLQYSLLSGRLLG